MKKKLRTRTKLVYISISAVVGLFILVTVCSVFDLAMPPDSFIVGWYSFFACELFCIAGITVKGKAKESDEQ